MEEMSRDEIRKYLKKLIIFFKYPNVIGMDVKEYIDILRIYLYQNPDTQEANDIKLFFAKVCAPQYNIDAIKEALSLPEDKYFYKKQEILKNYPFALKDKHILSSIGNIMFADLNNFTLYDGINYLIKEYINSEFTDDIDNELEKFKNNNGILFNTLPTKYDGLEIDHDKFMNYLTEKKFSWKDFEDFKELNEFYHNYNTPSKKDYYNYLLGKIGEYVIWERFSHNNNSTFVSRDLNDSFGYDIYFELNGIETLVEVKTTTSVAGRDIIRLSNHEFETCIEAKKHNAKYVIARVYIPEFEPYSFFYSFLQYDIENDRLYDPIRNIEYTRVENSHRHIYRNLNREYLGSKKEFTLTKM